VHVLQGDVRGGIAMLEEVRAAAHAEQHPRREATALLHLGKAARVQGDLARASAYLEDGLRIALDGGQRSIALDVLAELADVYQARGATGLALERLRAHQTLRDSVFSQHALQRIASSDALAALDRQEIENHRLRGEQRVREAVIERQRLVGALGAAILLMSLIVVGLLVRYNRTGRERERLLSQANSALAAVNHDLRHALSEVRALKGLIPICASCKKVRDDEGYWEAVETYISNRSDALFSHSICSDCWPTIYGKDWRTAEGAAVPAQEE
jgi:ATP/maltotriose-dependent transcriptional regulator MalT